MRKVPVPYKDGSIKDIDVYSVNEFLHSTHIVDLRKKFKKKKGYTENYNEMYLNVPVSFDIETSHVDVNDDEKQRFTFMYIWQMCIDNVVVMGRTWGEWLKLLSGIKAKIGINKSRQMIIFVQNLPYEYQFFHKRVSIEKTFCREPRKPLTCKLGGKFTGIDFRCTYSMSGKSLAKIAKDTISCPVLKQEDDLDYSVLRTQKTILTDTEMSYCVCDVLVLDYYLRDLIRSEAGCVANIPITKTGFLRRKAREAFGRDKEYHKIYNKLKLDALQFVVYNNAYRGGDTHASAIYCGETLEDVWGFDLASSYPTRVMCERFPLSNPLTLTDPTVDKLNYLLENDKLFVIDLNMQDVKFKGLGHFTYLPLSKCLGVGKYTLDNGRIVDANVLRTCCTSEDLKIIIDNYDFTITRINYIVYHETSGYLPKAFRDFTLMLYQKKTSLKHVDDRKIDYMLAKEDINSIYGMCVTSPLNDEVMFDEDNNEWIVKSTKINYDNLENIQKELSRTYGSRNHFMAYEIGVWISAWARVDLHRGLEAAGIKALYWDTDSVKFVGKNIMDKFKQLNEEKRKRYAHCGYTLEELSPKDKFGKSHMIGEWELDCEDVRFKTFGAKKYFYMDNDGGHVTVAGLNKKSAKNYLMEKYGDVTKIETGEIFSKEVSGRTYSIYSDEEKTMTIDGIVVNEKSYVSIVDTTYELSDTKDHELFIALSKAKLVERGCA